MKRTMIHHNGACCVVNVWVPQFQRQESVSPEGIDCANDTEAVDGVDDAEEYGNVMTEMRPE